MIRVDADHITLVELPVEHGQGQRIEKPPL